MLAVPLVAVVILNWNKAEETAACVEAVARQTYPRVLTLVVDNGSAAGSLGPLEALAVPFELIRNPQNLGFTGGVNTGIARAMAAGADYIWLLNNDATPDTNVLDLLVAAMQADARIGMASPIIREANAESAVQFCGGLWDGRRMYVTSDLAISRGWADQHPEQIWLVGAALLIRRAVIDAVGWFDDRFFAYWEDVDYSVRAIQAGYRNVVVTAAEVHHAAAKDETGSYSRGARVLYYMARNELLFTRKHVGWWAGRQTLYWAVRRALARALEQQDDLALIDASFLGVRDGLIRRYGPYDPARRLPAAVRRLLLAVNRALFGSH